MGFKHGAELGREGFPLSRLCGVHLYVVHLVTSLEGSNEAEQEANVKVRWAAALKMGAWLQETGWQLRHGLVGFHALTL